MKTSIVAGLAALTLLCGCLEFNPNGLYACDVSAPGASCNASDGGTNPNPIIPNALDGSVVGVFDAGPNAVTGQSVNWFVSSKAAAASTPDDLSNTQVEAYLLDGGAFITLAGVGRKDGTFVIPNVPPGATFYVRVGGDTSVTQARTLDFSTWSLGSANRGYASLSTPVTVNISKVSAWTGADVMQMVSLKAGLDYFYLPPFPANGVTSITATPDFQDWPLINTTVGDKVDISQLVADSADGGYTYSALRKTFSPPSVLMTDGMPLTITGELADIPASLTVTVDWKRSEYVAQRVGMTPIQAGYYSYTNIYAIPQANTFGTYNLGPHLTQYFSEDTATDVTMTFNFGNPFADTDLTGFTSTFFEYSYTAAGATAALTATATVSVEDGVAGFSAGPLRPRIGPVRNARINNVVVTGANNVPGQAITNVTLNPTFTWEAPTLGQPTLYRIEIHQLGVNAGETTSNFIATVHTRELRAVVPPKTLVAGRQYYARIIAIADVNRSPERPYRKSHPAAQAQVLTVIFSP